MKSVDFTLPREAARAFTPKLSDFVEQPLYSEVWTDPDLAPRDRSLITIACLIALNHSKGFEGQSCKNHVKKLIHCF